FRSAPTARGARAGSLAAVTAAHESTQSPNPIVRDASFWRDTDRMGETRVEALDRRVPQGRGKTQPRVSDTLKQEVRSVAQHTRLQPPSSEQSAGPFAAVA